MKRDSGAAQSRSRIEGAESPASELDSRTDWSPGIGATKERRRGSGRRRRRRRSPTGRTAACSAVAGVRRRAIGRHTGCQRQVVGGARLTRIAGDIDYWQIRHSLLVPIHRYHRYFADGRCRRFRVVDDDDRGWRRLRRCASLFTA